MKLCEKIGYLFLIFLFLSGYPAAQTASSSTQTNVSVDAHLDRDKLEAIEDQAEIFSHEMLELSIALSAFNTTQVASFFTDPAWMTPLPAEATDLVPEVKWIQRHGWQTLTKEAREMSQEEIIQTWDSFLAHF